MNKPSKESPKGSNKSSQDLPAGEHDTRSLSDDVTFGDQSLHSPRSLGEEATLGDKFDGSESGRFDDDMEIVDLEARYTIESTLGKGGMGEFLLTTDTRLDRKVTIKGIFDNAARSKMARPDYLTTGSRISDGNSFE